MARRHSAALALALACAGGGARASDTLLAELEQRLARSGVDAVNAHLLAHASSALVPLHQQTAACQRRAVSLTVRLSRGREARAAGYLERAPWERPISWPPPES
jgi:hypothetical protein